MMEQPDVILAERVIDGTGAEPLEQQAVLLREGRIQSVIPQADLTRTQREGAAVLDAGDATLLPGLIDAHVHLTFNAGPTHDSVRRGVTQESDTLLALRSLRNAQVHLAGGVTSLRDVGGRGFITLTLRDGILRGMVQGPRMQASGPAITTSNGHLNYLGAIASGVEEVRDRAEEVLDAGADLVKICATGGIMTAESDPLGAQYTVDELAAAVEVARERDTLVAAHALSAEGVERCVQAGVRSIEHCLWQDQPGVYQFRPEVAAKMLKDGVFVGLTFAGIGQARYREEVLGQPSGEDLGAWRGRLEQRFGAERATIDAGIPYVLHSDAGVRDTPFGAFWLILASACFELKLTPLEAIHAVTSTAAALMGWSSEVGTVAPGRWADLLIVDGNPAERIEALRLPRQVLLGGRVIAESGILRAPVTAPA